MRNINDLPTHEQVWAKENKDPKFQDAYKALDNDPDIILMEAMIAASQKGITQSQIAKRMGTTQSAISRAFTGTGNPSLKFLKRLADAIDMHLQIKFVAK